MSFGEEEEYKGGASEGDSLQDRLNECVSNSLCSLSSLNVKYSKATSGAGVEGSRPTGHLFNTGQLETGTSNGSQLAIDEAEALKGGQVYKLHPNRRGAGGDQQHDVVIRGSTTPGRKMAPRNRPTGEQNDARGGGREGGAVRLPPARTPCI